MSRGNARLTTAKAWEKVLLILYRERAKVLRPYETRVTVPSDFEVVNIDRQLPGRQRRAHTFAVIYETCLEKYTTMIMCVL